MPFVDPDTLAKPGASPETSPDAGSGGFVDPDTLGTPKAKATKGGPFAPDWMYSAEDKLREKVPGYGAIDALKAPQETALAMGSGFAGMAAGGVAAIGKGAYNLATKGFVDPDDVEHTFHGVADSMTYEPRSGQAKKNLDTFGKVYEGAKDFATDPNSPLNYKNPAYKVEGQDEGVNRSAGEFTFDALINVLPMLELKASVRKSYEAKLKAGDEQAKAELEQEVVRRANEQRQTEMFGTERVSNPPQYGLPEELRKQQEAELNPEVEQRQQGQGELFSDYAKDDMLMGEGGVGARDKIPGPDLENRGIRQDGQADKLMEREYIGPRQQGELFDNSQEFKRYDPNRVNDAVAAADKPGFQRDAIERMRAKELEDAQGPDARLGQNPTDFWNDSLSYRLAQAQRTDKNAVRGGLQTIRDSSTSPYYRELAKKLLDDPEFKPDFKLIEKYNREGTTGRYLTGEHAITMKSGLQGSEHIFLHEAIHARVYAAIEAGKQGRIPRQMQHLVVPVRRIEGLFNSLAGESRVATKPGAIRDIRDKYGMQDVHEFVAEGFTNPDFQRLLGQIKLPKELSQGTFKSYWDGFLHAINKLLRLESHGETYLSELLKSGADLMTSMGKEERIYFSDKLDPRKDLGMETEKKGFMPTMKEGVRDFQLDRRPIEDLVKQLQDFGKDIVDFSPNAKNALKHAYNKLGGMVKANLLQDTTLKLLMKDNKGTGALIKWVTDHVSVVDRNNMQKTKMAMDQALSPLRTAWRNKAARPELYEMWEKWKENIGQKDLKREDFRTDKQWKLYEGFQKVHDAILTEINEFRQKAGYESISRIPSYFHSIWEGDYRVFGHDAMGQKKWAMGASTRWGANRLAAKFEKSHPDLKWTTADVDWGKYGLVDLSAFDDALRVMASDDVVTKALQKTYQEILQHRGFGKTGLHKEGVLGFMGFEKGKMGIMKMDRAFEQYVNQAYRYTGNLEKQLILKDVEKIPRDIMNKIPETEDFLTSYIHKSRGAKLGGVSEDMAMGKFFQALGVGVSFPKRMARNVSQVASLYWLTTPRFIASQMVQSINALPKLVQEHGTFDGAKMFFEGWKNTIQPDALTHEATQWAAKKGYLDASIVNLVGHEWSERPINMGLDYARRVFGKPAALVEHHLVRLPVFNMFENALRDTVKDKIKRFEIAAEKADYYMVNYGRAHSPMVYDNMGIMGDLARPLKQYSHNYIGQFIEYTSRAKNHSEYAPLATFFGTQIAMAGLKGAMFVGEAAVLINLMNYVFQTNVPTPEQWMMKTGIHDAMVFGGLSYVTGQDISSSVAAPGMKNMLNLPAVDFTKGLVTDVVGYAIAFAHGEDTDHDRLRAWLAITPNIAHEYLRNLYTPKGQPVANPNDPDLKGNYRRSETEAAIATIVGTKSIDEAKADALMRNVRQVLKRDLDRRMDALGAITDRIKNGKPVDPKLIQSYIQDGGDPSRLSESVVRKLKEGYLTGPERGYDIKRMSPGKAHDLTIQQQLNPPPMDPNKPLGYSPTTGKVVTLAEPIAEQHGVGDKRILSDTEGNPKGNFLSKLPGGESLHKDRDMAKHPFKDYALDSEYARKSIKRIEDMPSSQKIKM